MKPFNTINLSLQDQLSLVSLPIYNLNSAHYQLSKIIILDKSKSIQEILQIHNDSVTQWQQNKTEKNQRHTHTYKNYSYTVDLFANHLKKCFFQFAHGDK